MNFSLISTMAPIRILIVNPNTTQPMTDALRPLIDRLGYNDVGTAH